MKRQPSDILQLHREQLVDIGQVLQASRESQALSHEALAEQTLIRPSLLQAMEQGAVEQLPEPVYTRGLIHRYAKALGLDADTLASQYFTPPKLQPQRSFWRVPVTPQLRPLHLYVAYILLIAIAISGLSYTLKRANYRPSNASVLNEQDLTAATRSADETSSTVTAPAHSEIAAQRTASDEPVRVDIQMRAQSWLRVTADQQVAFEGILKEGDVRHWTAQEQLTIRAGNAGGVMVSFNEGNAETLGEPGMVTEVTYSPEKEISLNSSQPASSTLIGSP